MVGLANYKIKKDEDWYRLLVIEKVSAWMWSSELQDLFLPRLDTCDHNYLVELMAGERKVFSQSEIRIFTPPRTREFFIKESWQRVLQEPALL